MPSNRMSNAVFRVAAAQLAPVFLDLEASLEKACASIQEAGRNGARLIAFPESYLPAYPDWVWAVPPGEAGLLNQMYAEMVANAIEIPGVHSQRLCQVAKESGVNVIMGATERNSEASGGSLYNTLLYINDQGILLGKHRKLVPTSGERLIWAPGDGSTLEVYKTPLGRVGGLICWENYMPLARYALYAWGIDVYVIATWDRGEPWLSTLRHIASEGRMYVISCGMPLRKEDIPDHYEFKQRYYQEVGEWINEGDSAIVDPEGEFIAGPLNRQESLLYGEVDLAKVQEARRMLDVAGHYARPDVFQLTVNRDARRIIEKSSEQ